MKIRHLFEVNLDEFFDYGEPPKRPKDAPSYYDELTIPQQRLWVKLNSFSFEKSPASGSKFKIKNYYSKGASSSSFYQKGTVTSDDFITDKYVFDGWATENTVRYSFISVTGRHTGYIWSKEKGFQKMEDLKPSSYKEKIGTHPTRFALVDGLSLNSTDGMPDNLDECNVSRNPIGSINELPTNCKKISAVYCDIESLKDIHKRIQYCEKLYLAGNPIKSNILGLLKIRGLKDVSLGDRLNQQGSDLMEIAKIIKKYLGNGDIVDCQDELIDAGFKDYAKL